jgi:Double zinc ribbon
MDDVERMYRHLVHVIRTKFTPMLSQPFEVGELVQTILPYRLHRRELGLQSNSDYERVLLELLAGPRGYLVVDDRMRDTLAAQLAAANPDPSVIRDFASSHVALAPEWLHLLESQSRASGVQGTVGTPTPTPGRPASHRTGSGAFAVTSTPPTSTGASIEAAPRRAAKPIAVAAGEHCTFCNGELPAGRQISFCPHCGQDLTMVHCPACGSELERGWKFCVTCGRASGEAAAT